MSHRSSVVGKLQHISRVTLEEVLPLPGIRGRLESGLGAKEGGCCGENGASN